MDSAAGLDLIFQDSEIKGSEVGYENNGVKVKKAGKAMNAQILMNIGNQP